MSNVNVKEFDDGRMVVEGYGVYFGGNDIVGDTFQKDTDFDLNLVPRKVLLYSHRKNKNIKSRIGVVTDVVADDVGLFFKAEINKAFKYRTAVKKLADLGLLGMSSGTADQLVERVNGTLKEWPVIELSLTTTPMEPRTVGATIKDFDFDEALKAIDELEGLLEIEATTESNGANVDAPENAELALEANSAQESGASSTKSTSNVNSNLKGVTLIMSDNSNAPVNAANPQFVETVNTFMQQYRADQTALEAGQKSLAGQLESLLAAIQGSPKIMGAGFVTQDGGTADKNIKSFADFLVSIRRKDTVRLAKVYGATKDLSGETGTAGAYTIPEEFETSLLQMSAMNSNVMSRVRTIPAGSDAGKWPVLDQYIAPTAGAGNTAMAAGVSAAAAIPGGTLTETEPGFEMLEWRLSKVGGYTEVENELMEDSPLAIEALLTSLFGIAINAKNERNVLRGTGVGEPLGILNASSAINVTPATNNLFSWPDVATMFSRFKSAGGVPIWLIHPSIWPDIFKMEIGTAGANAWVGNMSAGQTQALNGYQILMSEHLPQADNTGGVLLVDLSAYLFWQRKGIQIAFSEHAGFLNDKVVWRFTQRCDGKPWMRAPLTLADPQGSYTVSPYVIHAD